MATKDPESEGKRCCASEGSRNTQEWVAARQNHSSYAKRGRTRKESKCQGKPKGQVFWFRETYSQSSFSLQTVSKATSYSWDHCIHIIIQYTIVFLSNMLSNSINHLVRRQQIKLKVCNLETKTPNKCMKILSLEIIITTIIISLVSIYSNGGSKKKVLAHWITVWKLICQTYGVKLKGGV